MDTLLSKQPSIRTPINQRSPPTPDPSPPRSARSTQKTYPPPTLRYPSSRADSFTTARSHLESEDSESQISYHDALTPVERILEHARETRERYEGLGLAFESEAGDTTPTERSPSIRRGVERSPSLGDTWEEKNGDYAQSPNREWDTNFMRNVAVRRRRHERPPRTPPEQTSPQVPGSESSPISVMKRSQTSGEQNGDIKRHPRNPALDRFAKDIGWPNDTNESPRTDSKRFSTASSTSTVVEAVVVATPPDRHRILRHAGKNLALRQSSDTTFERPVTKRSKRSSLLSEETPPHRLLHHKARLPERRNRDSIDSTFSYVSADASVTEPKQHDSIPVLVIPKPPEDTANAAETPRRLQVRFHSLTDTPQSQSHGPEMSNGNNVHAESPRRVQRKSSFGSASQVSKASSQLPEDWPLPREGIRNFTAPAAMTSKGTTVTLSRVPKPPEKDASYRRNVKDVPPAVPPKEPLSLATPPLHPSDRISSPPAASEVQRLLQTRPTEAMVQRHSSDRASSRTEEIPRGSSLDRSTSGDRTHLSPESPMLLHSGRTSLDRARHHNTTTPFSQLSDTAELEVSEATAVSIYPHNNHSLLVVQQVARTNSNSNSTSNTTYHTSSSHRRTVSSPPLGRELSPPTLTFNPSTPPQQVIDSDAAANGFVDSPLKNPRKPPEPPAFKIIPPTPMEELDVDPMADGAVGSSSQRPARKQSLAKRARRYSDTILNPIFARTASVTRRNPKGQSPAISNPRQVKDNNLHPFWRPRGFWDDFNSESEDEWDQEAAAAYESSRLPRGGDTSDVGYENEERRREKENEKRKIGAIGRRLTNGFKGSGGFLIGNSLGMERHGSNTRRHYVNVAALQRKTTGLVGKPIALSKRFGGSSGRVEKQVSSNSLRRVAANNILHHPSGTAASPAGSGGSRISSRFSASTMGGDSDDDRGRGDDSSRGRSISSQRPKRRREFSVPGTRGGWKVEYVGLSGVREKLAERKREKKRNELRSKIGPKFYVKSTSIV
ncbi:hypothetical protein MPH_09896 [Macrophomina phaseolina MS6]|uniref:Uncharacterized protein n=1 Tax=Macrophomina phaseolina (strain MS6) TaxID=1126212 RepID=K2REG8_MACPH|nr:hypothetical protein MPH_09896 [Macrophomina phaseolina MS6]